MKQKKRGQANEKQYHGKLEDEINTKDHIRKNDRNQKPNHAIKTPKEKKGSRKNRKDKK